MSQTIKITYGNIMCPECYRGEMREITFASFDCYAKANMFTLYGNITCPYCGSEYVIHFDDYEKKMWQHGNITRKYKITFGED